MNEKLVSLSQVKKSFEYAIGLLQDWKETVTESNYEKFEIDVNQHRDLDPVRSVGQISPTGFEQKSPLTLTIVIKDHCNVGKVL